MVATGFSRKAGWRSSYAAARLCALGQWLACTQFRRPTLQSTGHAPASRVMPVISTLGASLAAMQKQLRFFSLASLQRLAAAALWHVMPPSVCRAAASAERLTAARSLRRWRTALACTGRSAWLPAAALCFWAAGSRSSNLASFGRRAFSVGAAPNPSINRTCPGKPGHAGYLQR